jgi:hypothetical protein
MELETATLKEFIQDVDNYASLLEFFGFDAKDKLPKDVERRYASKSAMRPRVRVGEWTIKSTMHGAARAYQRVPTWTSANWLQLFEKIVAKLPSLKLPSKEEVEVLFYSSSMKQGLAMAYDKSRLEMRVITVLPPGANIPLPNTKKYIVEGVELETMTFDVDSPSLDFLSLSLSEASNA